MQVGNVGSVILLQACISFINLISRITVKDIDSTCVLAAALFALAVPDTLTQLLAAHVWISGLRGGAQLAQAQRFAGVRAAGAAGASRVEPATCSPSRCQISMLCEYTAIIAVPIFVVAGALRLAVV